MGLELLDRTEGIAGRLEGSLALSCLDLEGHEAKCPVRARAGHQACAASVRESIRVSLKGGSPPIDLGTLQHGGRADFEPPLRPWKGRAGGLSERTMGYQDEK